MPSSSSNSGRLVKVAYAWNQVEAEMIQGLLTEHGIPSMVQRGRSTTRSSLPRGPRQVFVPEAAAEQAREVLAGTPGAG